MPARKDPEKRSRKIEVRGDEEWIAAVAMAAATMGESLSDYVRGAVNRQMVADGFVSAGRLDVRQP